MMRQHGRWIAWMCVGALAACGGDAPPPQSTPMEEAAASMTDAMQQMQGAMEQMAKAATSDAPLVSAETLQERMPASIDGLPRVSSERTQGGAMGINISTATAMYSDSATRSVTITITDAGKAGLLAALGAAWANVSVDRVTGDGYERTVTIDGHRGFESERRSLDGADRELSVVVGNRLLVQLEGANVSMDVLRQTLDRLRVQSLAPTP
jgi:hypothetical protein